VLSFLAMKRLRFAWLPLLLFLTSCHSITYNDQILVAVHDIPAGTVVQSSDFTLDHGWTLHRDDILLIPADAGPSYEFHFKTIRAVRAGQPLHWSNVEHR